MTIDSHLAYLQQAKRTDEFNQVVNALKARDYVLNRLPDAHIVRTIEKEGSSRYLVGVYAVELLLNKRQLVDVAKAAAPVLYGATFRTDNNKHPDYIFALPCWETAARQILFLDQLAQEQQNENIKRLQLR
jgi:hypothetical protein